MTTAPALRSLNQACDEAFDTRYFDESGFADAPPAGGRAVLARFELPSGYCGILEAFSQFTDEYAGNNALVETAGIEWQLLVNRQPVAPYLQLGHILNPWGWPAHRLSIRLPLKALVELSVIGVPPGATGIGRVGGRVFGRYWYSAT